MVPGSTRCLCGCHEGSIADRYRADGVDVTDPLEAAIACRGCQPLHCPALLDKRLPNDPERRSPEMAVWVDPPIEQGDGAE